MRNLAKDEIEMAARREAMLEEGFRLFSEKGIEAVTMLEVSKACRVGIATVYRYYKTKLALVIDICSLQWRRVGELLRAAQERDHVEKMTAAEELKYCLNSYIELYHKHKELLCFNQSFNDYVLHEHATQEQLQPYMDAIDYVVGLFHSIYAKGQQDGTIRTDMGEEKLFVTTGYIMMAVTTRFAQGLVYHPLSEKDRTEELFMLRDMILKTFVK